MCISSVSPNLMSNDFSIFTSKSPASSLSIFSTLWSVIALLVTSGVYGGLRLLPQIFVQNPDFKLSENSDTKADFRNPPKTVVPPARARNLIHVRGSDHEKPERVVMHSEKARSSN